MTDIFSVSKKASKSIKFKKLLDKYFELCDQYTKVFEYEDAVFGYTEMANVSLLSTAAWQNGWFSLVEYQAQKYKGANLKKNKKKKYKAGRVDLYICDDYVEEYICEAKQYFTKSDNIVSTGVLKKLKEAYDDVSRSTKDVNGERYDGYAILFLPHLTSRKKGSAGAVKTKEALKLSLKQLYNSDKNCENCENCENRIDGYGYYFPDKPIENWTGLAHHDFDLIGVSVLFRRVPKKPKLPASPASTPSAGEAASASAGTS